MALSNYTYFEVRTTGSDSTNSGGFDINSSGFPTDGSITSANTASPVISSASYTFVAGDVGAWVFIKSGTNSIPGWYKIASVNAGAATLIGTIGQAFIATALQPSTSLGCGTAATLSSITFGVDYSQQDAFRYTGIFVVQATTTNIVGSGITINRSWVGNLINLTSVAAGSAVSGYYNIVSIGGTVATLDRSAGTAGSASTGYVGGALFSPGKAGGLKVAGNKTYIKAGTYVLSTVTQNVSGGAINTIGGNTSFGSHGYEHISGYDLVRGDTTSNRPRLLAGVGFTNSAIINMYNYYPNISIDNIIFDGAGNTGVNGIRDLSNPVNACMVNRCKFTNLNSSFISANTNGVISFCEFSYNSSTCLNTTYVTNLHNCYFHDNTGTCVNTYYGVISNCIFANNNGTAIYCADVPGTIYNCTFYNNTGNGIFFGGNVGQVFGYAANNLFVNNGNYGINATSRNFFKLYNNVFYGNVLGPYNYSGNTSSLINLSGNPFVDAANGNFNLNNIAGAGASARALFSGPFVLDSNTINYSDPGAVQTINSPTVYINPEKYLTVKAGTTSRTEYIYLNTAGQTFSSTGLSASYVRAGFARTSIPLVSQTVTGAFTAGGFCEIDSVNMPGLYRFDVPNAVFATGVKTATVEIINTTNNDRQILSYQFSQDQTLDFTQPVPTSNTVQTVGDALNAARAQGFGKWVLSGTALTIYAGDNSTIVKTFTIDSITNPTSRT